MNKIPADQLLFEVEDIIRSMPDAQSLGNDSSDILAWIGRASAAMHAWDSLKATAVFDTHVRRLGSTFARDLRPAVRGVLVMLHQAHHDLRMRTVGPLSVGISKGALFEYFDELRKVVELARTDILFIDPYLDAEFVARYMPFVAPGATVRLLGREKMAALVASASLCATQHAITISIRGTASLHDRYVIVDGSACYQSGASFKDGAKKAGTTLTQVTDAFSALHAMYEGLWLNATVHT